MPDVALDRLQHWHELLNCRPCYSTNYIVSKATSVSLLFRVYGNLSRRAYMSLVTRTDAANFRPVAASRHGDRGQRSKIPHWSEIWKGYVSRKIRIALWLIEIAVVITHPTSLRRPERADR